MNFNKRAFNVQWLFLFCLILLLFITFIHEQVTFSNNNKINHSSSSEQFIPVSGIINNSKINYSFNEYIADSKDNPRGELAHENTDFSNVKVIPGGQSIGIQLQTLGVLVVGHHKVSGGNGHESPGNAADIQVGDIILKINNTPIQNVKDMKPLIENAGENNKKLSIKLKREQEIITTSVNPVKDEKGNNFSIGLYIRDEAAGIGTLSFYDPKSKKYGALGHVISDIDTKKPIEIEEGKIVLSHVTNVKKGTKQLPGEKHARFSINDKQLGTVTKNSPYGIFGTLNEKNFSGYYNEPMSIGLSHEVEEGPAKILTVVDGEEIEEFSIEIVSNHIQNRPSTKGMVIKITDSRLLDKTGGIVQGMSGSPIIQNGKIIGAVTHVFVNDPSTGYGVHVEWMLQDAKISSEGISTKAS